MHRRTKAKEAFRLAFGLAAVAMLGPAWNLRAQDAPDVEAGRAIVVGANTPGSTAQACYNCHGIDGAGDAASNFPRLTDQTTWYLYQALRDYASGARDNPIMTPIAQALTDAQMRDVSAYYASVDGAPYPTPPEVDPDVLQKGAALSASGDPRTGVQACINCHGPYGVGLPPTYPFLAGQHAGYLRDQLRKWRTGERRSGELQIMQKIAERMTEEQIEAVSLYFASIQPPSVTPEDAGPPSFERETGRAEEQPRAE